MGLSIREVAKLVRRKDLAALDALLDALPDYERDQVTFGRADADRVMRRDPPLPQLAEDPLPSIIGWRFNGGDPVDAAKARAAA